MIWADGVVLVELALFAGFAGWILWRVGNAAYKPDRRTAAPSDRIMETIPDSLVEPREGTGTV